MNTQWKSFGHASPPSYFCRALRSPARRKKIKDTWPMLAIC